MKKIYLTLQLVALSFTAYAQSISNYFNIHQHDGTIGTFLRNRIDSISYSINDNGSIHQLIHSSDSIFVYSVDNIDSVVFHNYNLEDFCPDSNHPHLIDLGLPDGTKWACCNVGASSPLDVGDYFAWGETEPKDYFYEDNYFTNNYYIFFGCFRDLGGDISGTSYDAAHVNWGGDWKMPTYKQSTSLMINCKLEGACFGGVYGCILTGWNGNKIFVPISGGIFGDKLSGDHCCSFWSSNHNVGTSGSADGVSMPKWGEVGTFGSDIYCGHVIRPVQNQIKIITNEICPDTNHPHAIDLGIGTLWSCCNVEASSPEETGGHYAWGETNTKASYHLNNYSLYSPDTKSFVEIEDIAGTSFDAANSKTGRNWITPNIEQCNNLIQKCKSYWVKYKDTFGRLFEGPNGNKVFFPAGGLYWGDNHDNIEQTGNYWLSNDESYNSLDAKSLEFSSGGEIIVNSLKDMGRNVRPVMDTYKINHFSIADICPNEKHPHIIDLGLPSGTKWSCCNLEAKSPEEHGGYYAWAETEDKETYNTKNYSFYTKATDYQNIGIDISGTIHDAANILWGTEWNTPSMDQFEELSNNTISTWGYLNDIYGKLFIGKSGRKLFLPAAGFYSDGLYKDGIDGKYWSSNVVIGNYKYAFCLSLCLGDDTTNNRSFRDFGLNIRPIHN